MCFYQKTEFHKQLKQQHIAENVSIESDIDEQPNQLYEEFNPAQPPNRLNRQQRKQLQQELAFNQLKYKLNSQAHESNAENVSIRCVGTNYMNSMIVSQNVNGARNYQNLDYNVDYQNLDRMSNNATNSNTNKAMKACFGQEFQQTQHLKHIENVYKNGNVLQSNDLGATNLGRIFLRTIIFVSGV